MGIVMGSLPQDCPIIGSFVESPLIGGSSQVKVQWLVHNPCLYFNHIIAMFLEGVPGTTRAPR